MHVHKTQGLVVCVYPVLYNIEHNEKSLEWDVGVPQFIAALGVLSSLIQKVKSAIFK